MVDGGDQARAFAQTVALPAFRPSHVSHKQVEAYPIAAAEFRADGSGKVALKGGVVIDVPRGFALRAVPAEGDILVRYEPTVDAPDGYLAHSPRAAFEDGYRRLPSAQHHKSYEGGGRGLSFGQAIEQLKAGDRVARDGWNGKGMWLSLSGGTSDLPAEKFWSPHNRAFAEANGGSATVLPCITMKTATGEILMGWLASQTDMLAEDWCVV